METQSLIPAGLQKLSALDKLRLAQELRVAVAMDPGNSKLTPEQEAELDRCLAEHEADPEGGLTWEEVLKKLGR